MRNYKYAVLRFESDGKLGICPNKYITDGFFKQNNSVTVHWNGLPEDAKVLFVSGEYQPSSIALYSFSACIITLYMFCIYLFAKM